MIKYTIYTQNKNKEEIKKILNTLFNAYTITNATGAWQGKTERSLKIEIIALENAENNVKYACQEIKALNHQEDLLLTKESGFKTEFF